MTKHPSSLFRGLIPLAGLAFVVSACNTTDATLGVKESPFGDTDGHSSSSSAIGRIDLGTLGGSSSYATDINSGDIVVGWSETSSGATHAFRWSRDGGMVDLGTLPGDRASRAVAIVDGSMAGGGQILGVSGSEGDWTPVVWSATGTISRLPIPLIPDFSFGHPIGFNAAGDVVGWDAGPGLQHGWSWSVGSGKYDLSANVEGGSNEGSAGGITSSGLVVLTSRSFTCSQTVECWRTYLWSRARGYVAIGTPGSDSEANVTGLGLNEAGTIVGWASTSDATSSFPYRWAASTGFTPLPEYSTGSSRYGYATAVNALGAVVGADFEPTSGSIVATLWPASGGIVRLSAGDPNPSVAVAINGTGSIAGWAAVSDQTNHAVVWSSTLKVNLNLVADISVGRNLSTASAPCLKSARGILSRQALFDCVAASDRSARHR